MEQVSIRTMYSIRYRRYQINGYSYSIEQNMVTCLQLRGWKVALEDSVVVYNTSTMDLAKEKQLWNKRLRGMTYAFTQNFGKILMSSELGILKKILNIILLLLPWIQVRRRFRDENSYF